MPEHVNALCPPFRTSFFAWGLLFHLANALVMGLNSFIWAFVATYPAILFTKEACVTNEYCRTGAGAVGFTV